MKTFTWSKPCLACGKDHNFKTSLWTDNGGQVCIGEPGRYWHSFNNEAEALAHWRAENEEWWQIHLAKLAEEVARADRLETFNRDWRGRLLEAKLASRQVDGLASLAEWEGKMPDAFGSDIKEIKAAIRAVWGDVTRWVREEHPQDYREAEDKDDFWDDHAEDLADALVAELIG